MTPLTHYQPPFIDGKFVDIFTVAEELLEKYGQNGVKDENTREKLNLLKEDFRNLLNELNKLVKTFAESEMDIDRFFFLYSHRVQAVLMSLYILLGEILDIVAQIENKSPMEILEESTSHMYSWKDELMNKLARVYEGVFRNKLLDYISNKTFNEEEIQMFNKLNFLSLGWMAVLDGEIQLNSKSREKLRKYLENAIEQVIEFWSDVYLAKKMDESINDEPVDSDEILNLLSDED